MEKAKNLLQELCIINIGLVIFAESLAVQKVKMVHVEWRPPAGGDEALQNILNLLLR